MIYEEIKIGSAYSFEKVITEADVFVFADLTGDHNRLHVDKAYGRNTDFKQNIIHGMLVGSLFSTLIGMYCPGENSLYLSQTLNFRLPVFPSDKVLVRGEVVEKNDSIKTITLRTEVLKDSKIVVDGQAKVKLLA